MNFHNTIRRPSRNVVIILTVIVIVAVFFLLLGIGLANKASVTGRSGLMRMNKPAPDFVLPLLNGGELNLSERIGEPIVVNFWASWCPPCREEAVTLERTWREYRDRRVNFIGIAVQDTLDVSRAYLKEFDITYPNGLDGEGTITVDYGVIGLPVTFFINREGIVVRRWVGALDEATLNRWTADLFDGVQLGNPAAGENPGELFPIEEAP